MTGTKVDTLYEYEPELFSRIDNQFLERLVRESKSMMVLPQSAEVLTKDDLNVFYDEKLANTGIGYSMRFDDLHGQQFSMKRHVDTIFMLQAKLQWTKEEWEAILRSRYSFVDKVNALADDWAVAQDVKAFIGHPDHEVTSFADTTNNTTAHTGTSNFTSIANVHATAEALVDSLEDGLNRSLQGTQVMWIMDKAAKRKLTSLLDVTVEFRTGFQHALAALRERTAPTSQIQEVRMLGGSATYDEVNRVTITDGAAGTTAMYPMDNMILDLKMSDLIMDDDPVTAQFGKYMRYGQRWKLRFKRQVGVMYDAATTLT